MRMRICSHQPEMIMWALASLIFDSIWQLKNKLYTHKKNSGRLCFYCSFSIGCLQPAT